MSEKNIELKKPLMESDSINFSNIESEEELSKIRQILNQLIKENEIRGEIPDARRSNSIDIEKIRVFDSSTNFFSYIKKEHPKYFSDIELFKISLAISAGVSFAKTINKVPIIFIGSQEKEKKLLHELKHIADFYSGIKNNKRAYKQNVNKIAITAAASTVSGVWSSCRSRTVE